MEEPAQIVAELTVVPTEGNGLTVISLVEVAVHPFAAVPVTVYVVVPGGVTFMVEPLKPPGCQLYVLAPVPVILVDAPAQIVAFVTVVPTEGEVFTVIRRKAVAVHPFALVPVTV